MVNEKEEKEEFPPIALIRGMDECLTIISKSDAPVWKKLLGYGVVFTPWFIILFLLSWAESFLESFGVG